ncbi:hypothetical protein OAK75_05205 [Bacteriovoracales bacterium]|nr:hypothetical protein [Bacteriovoracales bacterium]
MKTRNLLGSFFIIGFFVNLSSVNANYKETLAKIYIHYSKAEYPEALKKLKTVKGDQSVQALVHYWNGKVFSKAQEYDKADTEFKKAIKKKAKIKDLYYLYGQTLYASQELKMARRYFLTSAIKKKFKPGASYYYSGVISQILEEPKKAKRYYGKIIKLKKDKDGVKKPSLFQIAKINYAKILKLKDKEKIKELVKNNILPQMAKARDYKKKHSLTRTIATTMMSLKRKHKIGLPGRMINGRRIPKNPWSNSVTFDVKNDTNILSQAEDSSSLVASPYTDISGKIKYRFNSDKKDYSFHPSFKISTKRHLKRDNSSIYQNDNLSVDPTFGIVKEHKAFKYMAKTMLDLEYNYTMQDPNSKQNLEYYTNHILVSVGQEFRPFSMGDTTIKLKYKKKGAYTDSLVNNTVTFNLSQKAKMGSITLNTDFNTYKHSQSSSTNDYKLTLTPTISKKVFGFSLAPTYSFTLTDNIYNSSKGKETSHDPSITMTKKWKDLSANINYAFTKKTSEEASSSYTKHIFGFGMTYNL